MSRTQAALALVTVLSLGGCASTSGTKYSVTPQTQVTVRGANKKPAQANFRVTPEESMRTGAGGGGSEK
jgi:PBP1b-binding outer membrane lipoprotein LpoB